MAPPKSNVSVSEKSGGSDASQKVAPNEPDASPSKKNEPNASPSKTSGPRVRLY